jgi:hypothetical protein
MFGLIYNFNLFMLLTLHSYKYSIHEIKKLELILTRMKS